MIWARRRSNNPGGLSNNSITQLLNNGSTNFDLLDGPRSRKTKGPTFLPSTRNFIQSERSYAPKLIITPFPDAFSAVAAARSGLHFRKFTATDIINPSGHFDIQLDQLCSDGSRTVAPRRLRILQNAVIPKRLGAQRPVFFGAQ